MRMPTAIEVDLEDRVGYVYYVTEPKVSETVDVWRDGQVAADLDVSGNILGIEVLGLDDETLRHAREFASKRGLGFPVKLAEALSIA